MTSTGVNVERVGEGMAVITSPDILYSQCPTLFIASVSLSVTRPQMSTIISHCHPEHIKLCTVRIIFEYSLFIEIINILLSSIIIINHHF